MLILYFPCYQSWNQPFLQGNFLLMSQKYHKIRICIIQGPISHTQSRIIWGGVNENFLQMGGLENPAIYRSSIHASIIIDSTEGNRKRASCTEDILERLIDLQWRDTAFLKLTLGRKTLILFLLSNHRSQKSREFFDIYTSHHHKKKQGREG